MRQLLLTLGLLVFAAFCDCGITRAQVPASAPSSDTDPAIPSEPGMYLKASRGFIKILGQIVSFTRTGSHLVSKITIGIKASKDNVQLLGPHAQSVVGRRPTFYFIPPKQEADAGVNAGDFILIRLEEKPQRRQFEVGAQGAWRASRGISITHQIQLARSEVKLGTYSITPAVDLRKGEYALYLARGEGMQAYVYDFSVDPQSAPTTAIATKEAGSEASGPNRSEPDVAHPSSAGSSVSGASVEIISDPLGADVEIDGKFVGNTPSSIGLANGEHTLRVSKTHYKDWERTLHVSTGTIKITAALEPITGSQPTQNSAGAANSPERYPEESIGISFNGNPKIRHNGLEVSRVQSKGPTESIGVQVGDAILAIDGHYVYTIEEFRAVLAAHDRNLPIALRYRHDRLTYENNIRLKDTASPTSLSPSR